MRNLNAKGGAWLALQQRRNASTLVTYQRGATTLRLPAVRAKTDAVTLDSGAGAVDASIDDWIVAAADLIAAGVRFEPTGGDLIVDSSSGAAVTYEAMSPPGGGKCWRWSDPQGIRYRIHVRVVSGAA